MKKEGHGGTPELLSNLRHTETTSGSVTTRSLFVPLTKQKVTDTYYFSTKTKNNKKGKRRKQDP